LVEVRGAPATSLETRRLGSGASHETSQWTASGGTTYLVTD